MIQRSYLSVEAKDNNDIGILIRDFGSIFQGTDFIRVASLSPQEILPLVQVKWRNPINFWQRIFATKNVHPAIKLYRKGFGLAYGRCDRHPPYRLHFFKFGETARLNFPLNDLLFPIKLKGFLWIIDIQIILLLQQDKQSLLGDRKEFGAITWTREQQLPFVIAVTGSQNPLLSVDEIRTILSLEKEMPIIPCPSKFDSVHVEHVLSALLGQMSA